MVEGDGFNCFGPWVAPFLITAPKFARMKKIILLAFLFGSLGLWGQFQNIRISGSGPGVSRGVCEPSLAIDPSNPAQVVAGAILNEVFWSKDSGHTWQQQALSSPFGVWGDPVIAADPQGHFYYFHLSDPTGENWQSEEILDRIVVQRSDDGGENWSDGSYMGMHHPKDQDKHWVDVDRESGYIYATWTQFDDYGSKADTAHSNILFSRSRDQGLSWSPALKLSEKPGDCLDGDSTTEGAVPAVGPNGEVYVAWSNQGHIYFDRSLDSGRTWLEQDQRIAEHVGGWEIEIPGLLRCNGMPVTVADDGDSEGSGNVYVQWVDKRAGHHDVWLIRSEDQGQNWSQPVRVNSDSSEADQFLAWLEVDPSSGYLYSVFYDRRHYNDEQTDVFLAWSKDGGRSWQNHKISEKPFIPRETVFFGDYNDIDIYQGMVRPIWTRFDPEGLSVWTAIINQRGLDKLTEKE